MSVSELWPYRRDRYESITIERYGHLEAEDARSPLERLLLSPYGTEDEVLVDEAELHRRYGVVRRW